MDRLDIIGTYSMEGTYEDYIFGKMHNLPYNKKVIYETKVLECIYVDLWGLLLVMSAGGSHYFMLLMNEASLF